MAKSVWRRAFFGNSFDRPVSAKPSEDRTKNHSILEPMAKGRPPVRVNDGNVLDDDVTGSTTSLRIRQVFVSLVLALAVSVEADSQTFDDLVDRYEEFLLFKQSDYQDMDLTKATLRDVLMPEFNRAVRRVRDYPYDDPLRDPGGTEAAALTNHAVTNGTVAPTLSAARVDGAALTLTYTKALDEGSVPLATDYAATVAGSSRAVTGVEVSGSTVILTLTSVVTSGQTVTVSYAVPVLNAVRDAGGTQAGALTNQAVTNGTAAPTLSAAAVDGAALTLSYSEAVDESVVPLATDYGVTVAGLSRAVTGVEVSGSTVILTLSSAVTSAQTVTVSYTVPAMNALRDAGGTQAGALTNQAVTNGTSAPTLSTAAVDGAALTLTYSKALDEGTVPSATDYGVTVAGLSRAVTGVEVSGSTVILTLSSAVTSAQTVTVSYTVPAMNALRDAGGTQAGALTNQAVTNGTSAPTLSTAAVDGAALTLTYSETMDVTGRPEPSAFTVTVAGLSLPVTDVGVSGSTVRLRLETAVTSSDVVTVSYTLPVKKLALFVNRGRNAPSPTAEELALEDLNDDLHSLFNVQVPRLVFAYLTPGVDGEVLKPLLPGPSTG